MTTILTLDLGTQTGWALRVPGMQQIVSGSQPFKPGLHDGGGMRFLRFRRWLEEIHGTHRLGEMYFEEVRRHKGTDAGHIYGGLLGMLTAWCEERGVPYSGVPVGTIKKHATGKGNAGKPEMIAAVTSWGFRPTDDNEADAIALMRYVVDQQANPGGSGTPPSGRLF